METEKSNLENVSVANPQENNTIPEIKPPSPATINIAEEGLKEIKKLKQVGEIRYNYNKPLKLNFRDGSYADIERNGVVLRTVPFVWQTDVESNQSWAFFWADQFYGTLRKQSTLPWRRVKRRTVIIPFNKGEHWTEPLIGGGFKARFDENAQAQIPVKADFDKAQLGEFIKEGQHISQNLLLYRQLQSYLKPKANWTFIAVLFVAIVLIAIGAWLFLTHPHFLSSLGGMFGGLKT